MTDETSAVRAAAEDDKTFAIHGDIVWSRHNHTLSWAKDGYLVVVDGVVQGVYQQIPAEYEGIRVIDRASSSSPA